MTSLSPDARHQLAQPFALLAERLRAALGTRRMIFMQNNGNFGDALIRYGTLRFFEDLGLSFREFDMKRPTQKLASFLTAIADRAVDRYLFVYSGNGAWSSVYAGAYSIVRRLRKCTRNIFLLPGTYETYRMTFDFPAFVRDRFESQNFLTSGLFCHDMAFYLALIAPERVLPNRQPPTTKAGFIFRADGEGRAHGGMNQWPRNHDISAFGSHRSDPQEFLRYLDQFEHILTDRLHVAIGGALLGKQVTVLSGSYFKIKAIYRSSIAGIFDNIEFVEHPSPRQIEEYRALPAGRA
jgi:CDP-glycerol glycerophosphotransferase